MIFSVGSTPAQTLHPMRTQSTHQTSVQTGILRTPDGAQLSYFTFGNGQRPMVYIPGAGDGLATAHQASQRLKWWIKGYDKHFKGLYISRRDPLSSTHTHEDIARDVIWAMETLGWGPSLIEGQSAGGAIAQWVAALRPDLAPLLVLSSTAGWLEDHAVETIQQWRQFAIDGNWSDFFDGVARCMWQDRRMLMLRPFERLLTQNAVPTQPERLLAILDQLLRMDHRPMLSELQSQTLISAGTLDLLFPPTQQKVLSELIPNTHLYLGDRYGHGHDIANPKHAQRVAAFARMHQKHLILDRAS